MTTNSKGKLHAENMLGKRLALLKRREDKQERLNTVRTKVANGLLTVVGRLAVKLPTPEQVKQEMICPFCHCKDKSFELGGGLSRNAACSECGVIRTYYVERNMMKLRPTRNVFTKTR